MKEKEEEKLTISSPVKWTDLAEDVKSGMTDEEIMKKYGWNSLSQLQLQKSQLVQMGLVSPKDILQKSNG